MSTLARSDELAPPLSLTRFDPVSISTSSPSPSLPPTILYSFPSTVFSFLTSLPCSSLQTDDVDVLLTKVIPIKKVALVVVTGDQGLCGSFNNFISKKVEARIKELKDLSSLDYIVISVGKKGNSYFLRRPYIPVDKYLEVRNLATAKEAQAVADDVFSLFISEEVDKVELLYTKFMSLVKYDLLIHTLLPLSPKGDICDINGNCVDTAEDELFRLTMKERKLTVERETVRRPTADFSPIFQFKQDHVQILDALLPLYLNSQILRALQESLASELVARMSAMSSIRS